MSAPYSIKTRSTSEDISCAARIKKKPNSGCATMGFAPSQRTRSTSPDVASHGMLARMRSTPMRESMSRSFLLHFATAILSDVIRLWIMDTSELDTVGEYSSASLVIALALVLTSSRVDASEHQLRDFLILDSLDSGATNVRFEDTPSSV